MMRAFQNDMGVGFSRHGCHGLAREPIRLFIFLFALRGFRIGVINRTAMISVKTPYCPGCGHPRALHTGRGGCRVAYTEPFEGLRRVVICGCIKSRAEDKRVAKRKLAA